MAKVPKKGAVGSETVYEGVELIVAVTGQYNGQDQTAWVVKATNEKAFKKVNGQIVFVGGSGEAQSASTSKPAVAPEWGSVDDEFEDSIAEAILKESNFTATAANIARGRYPGLPEDSATFGMIVNAIKTHLVELS